MMEHLAPPRLVPPSRQETAEPVGGDLKHGEKWRKEGNGQEILPQLCALLPAIPQVQGSQRRGEVIMLRPSRAGRRSRSLPVGGARWLPPASAGAGPRRAGGSGNSRSQAPPAHFSGKTPNTSWETAPRPLWGSGAASSGCCGCATRVGRSHSSRRRDASRRAEPCSRPGPRGAGARAGQDPAAREGDTGPAAACPGSAPPPAAPQHLDNKSCRRPEWAGLGSAPPAHTPLEPIDVQMPMGPRGLEPRRTHTAPRPSPRPLRPGASSSPLEELQMDGPMHPQ